MNISQAKELLKDDLPFQAIVDFADQILKYLNLRKNATILDIGTGEGNMAVTLGLNGYHVITGEPADDESQYAKRDWQAKAEKLLVDDLITFVPLHADDLPFESNFFDAVFLFGCLHHMPESIRNTVIKECMRTTTDQGYISIFEPTPKALEVIRRVDPEHPDVVDPVRITQHLDLKPNITHGDFFNAFIFQKSVAKKETRHEV